MKRHHYPSDIVKRLRLSGVYSHTPQITLLPQGSEVLEHPTIRSIEQILHLKGVAPHISCSGGLLVA